MVTTKAIAKVAAVATGLAMATSMFTLAPMVHAASLTNAQVQSILSLLSSFGADSATIANVQSALTGTGGSMSGGSGTSTGGSTTSCSFTRDLTVGSTGDDVSCLQRGLLGAGYSIPALSSGAAAYGYFGSQTVAAVSAWQKAAGVSPAVGYFGAISRAHWNLSGGSSGSTGGVSAGTGTGLKVALSATSPNGTVLVQGQAIGDLADFTFANPTSAPISVTGLTLNRTGVSNDSTLTNIYLYSGGTRLTDSVGISSSQFSFTDSNGLFTVPAGSTYTVSVRSDIADSTSGQQIGVSLVSVSSTGTLDSSATFPINSGYQTISAATLATVVYTNANATPAATTISAQNDYPIWQDNVSVSTNPVKLTSMKFTNLGSADNSSIVNLRLYVDGTVVSTVPSMNADRSVTFDLSAAPVTLSTSSHVIKVLANITNSAASRTIEFSVQRASDGMFVDTQLGQPVTAHVTNSTTNFSTVSTGSISIQSANGAGVSVSLDPASPTQAVAAGATNVDWADFDFLASGENVKVSDLYVYAATTTAWSGDTISNGKIVVNGVQVGSTKALGTTSGTQTDFSLGSSLILPAGQTTKVSIYADAKATTGGNLSSGTTMTINIAAGSSNGQGQSSLTSTDVPANLISSNAVTVSSSSLTATSYSGYGAQTIVAGANNAKIGAFTLSAGSTEGITVNTIGIKFANAVSSTITNLTLKDDATGNTIGTIITTPGSSAGDVNSFAVNLDIPVSSTKTIDIYGNVLSGAQAGTMVAQVDYSTAGTGDTTGQSAAVGTSSSNNVFLQTISIGKGLLTVTQGAGDPVSNNVLAGASSVNVGEFTFTGQNSAYTVQNLDILIANGVASSVSNVTVSYKDSNGTTHTNTQALAVSATSPYATATFTGLQMYVPTNDSANLDVSVGTPTIASGATSGAAIVAYLDTGKTSSTFRAVNSAGSATTTVNGGTNIHSNGTFYVRKSIPTFAAQTSGLPTVPATNSPLYKFSITADPAGAIEWTKLAFNISTSSATVTHVYLTDDATGVSLQGSSVYATTTATKSTFFLPADGTTAYQQIAAGATKTYDLYGTVTGFTTGSSVTISLAADNAHVADGTAGAKATGTTNNIVWSDRSKSSHSVTTSDWSNGYLLKNFTSNAYTYSK